MIRLSPISSTRQVIAGLKYRIGKFNNNNQNGSRIFVRPYTSTKPHCFPLSKQTAASEDALHKNKTEKNNQGALIATGIGAAVNIGLAGSKGVIGYTVGSTALIADCFNSFGDLFSDAVVFFSVIEARKGASPERPWGRGKFEPLGAFVVGGLLGFTGLGIAFTALSSVAHTSGMMATVYDWLPWMSYLFGPASDFVISLPPLDTINRSSGKDILMSLSGVQYAALGISALSVASKELLFRYTMLAGQKANSDAVIANAWQHRSDAFVSGTVFAGIAGSYAGYPILDPIAGMLVSGFILTQAWSISRKALRDLSDAPANKEETQSLRNTCLLVPGIQSVVDLKARRSGPFLFVECTVGVHGDLSASAAHRLAELVRVELMRRHKGRVANAVVDVDPLGSTGLGEMALHSMRNHEQITLEVKRALLEPQRSASEIKKKRITDINSSNAKVIDDTLMHMQAAATKTTVITDASILTDTSGATLQDITHPTVNNVATAANTTGTITATESSKDKSINKQQSSKEVKELMNNRQFIDHTPVEKDASLLSTSSPMIQNRHQNISTFDIIEMAPYQLEKNKEELAKQESTTAAIILPTEIQKEEEATVTPLSLSESQTEFDDFDVEVEEDYNDLRHITSVSEVIVYYKDDGRISLKVDVCMNSDLTIRKAHKIAVLARKQLMKQIEGLSEVDVDLELEDSDDDWKIRARAGKFVVPPNIVVGSGITKGSTGSITAITPPTTSSMKTKISA